jgi:curli biogenesis system outer membrane secretion channel CsgG
MHIYRYVILALSALLLVACATPAPNYGVVIANVQKLKESGAKPTSVGEFTAQSSAANNETISIRGNPMSSPKGTFSAYVRDALVAELTEARLLNPTSTTQVSAVLVKNDISAAGFVTANAEIEVRFVVRQGATVRYDAIKRATIEWDSNFLGGIAIPRAHANYPRLVSTLLADLYSDPAFLAALKI